MSLSKWLFRSAFIFLGMSCTGSTAPQSTENPPSDSLSPNRETTTKAVKISLGSPASPLHRIEIEYTQWPNELQEQIEHDEQVASIANLLRSPCAEGWYAGETLNESVFVNRCSGIERRWLVEIDRRLKAEVSIEDILFTMVAPGPFMFSHQPEQKETVVYVDTSSWDARLLESRIEHLESNLQKPVVVVFTDQNPFVVIKNECIKNGQLLSELLAKTDCIEDNRTIEPLDVSLKDISTFTKPLWIIKGYQLSGYQSNRQLSHIFTLP